MTRLGTRVMFRTTVASAIVMLLLFYIVITESLINVWRNPETFWTRIITTSPTKLGRAYLLRSVYLREKGRNDEALQDLDIALEIAQRTSLSAIPRVYSTRAGVYERMGRLQEALADYSKVIELSTGQSPGPDSYSPWGDYIARGEILMKLGRTAEAQQDFDRAEAIKHPGDFRDIQR